MSPPLFPKHSCRTHSVTTHSVFTCLLISAFSKVKPAQASVASGGTPGILKLWDKGIKNWPAFLVSLSPSKSVQPVLSSLPRAKEVSMVSHKGWGGGCPPHTGTLQGRTWLLRIRNWRKEPRSEGQGPEFWVLGPALPELTETSTHHGPQCSLQLSETRAHLSLSESLEISSFVLLPPLDLPLSPTESAWELHDPFFGQGS